MRTGTYVIFDLLYPYISVLCLDDFLQILEIDKLILLAPTFSNRQSSHIFQIYYYGPINNP